jgi:hypothetical protein
MKKFAKTFFIATGVSFLLFWITWGLLVVVLPPISLWQLFGFAPLPQPSFWQSLFMLLLEVLGMPMSLMMSVSNHGPSMVVIVLLSLANSVVWGLCIGFTIYAIKRKLLSHAA